MTKLIRRSLGTLTARPPDLQEVRLKPAPIWSQMMVWSITATAVPGFGFAVMAKIDEVVVAPGTLQPRGAERPIKSSLSGVVGQILVEEGQRVPKGQPLLRLDHDVSEKRKSTVENETQWEQERLLGQT